MVYGETSNKALFGQTDHRAWEILVPIAVPSQGDLSGLHAYLVFFSPSPGNGGGKPSISLARTTPTPENPGSIGPPIIARKNLTLLRYSAFLNHL
ncbi:MAG: hypothetical protein LBU18_01895 [Treponema sp.]|jgi:hypothetical protein|nr:hypothetical protein [Treponema sp.]